MEFYETDELVRVIAPVGGHPGIVMRPDAATEIARRPAARPDRQPAAAAAVRDYAEVRGDGKVTVAVARAALAVYDVDDLGFDRLDRAVLGALIRGFGGDRSVCPRSRWRSVRGAGHRRRGV